MHDLSVIKHLNAAGASAEETQLWKVLRQLEGGLAERGVNVPLGYSIAQAVQEIARAIHLANARNQLNTEA